MFEEVIVCDQCGNEGCTVKEIAVQAKVTMTEFAGKHGKVKDRETQARELHRAAHNRAFEIKCHRCGHTHRFQPEKVMPAAANDNPGQAKKKKKGTF